MQGILCTCVFLVLTRAVFLSCVFESTAACCEAGVEDVVMTTVDNDQQVTTA